MFDLIQNLGAESVIVFLLLLLGVMHNNSLQEMKRRVKSAELDLIELRLQLVEAGSLTIQQTLSYFERKRSEGDDSGANILARMVEKMAA